SFHIFGAHDKVSNPAEIIPNQDPNSTKAYVDKADEREEGLKNIFPNSPYVRLLVPEKMGYHNVSYSRPESSARTVLYMLNRYKRQQPQPAKAIADFVTKIFVTVVLKP
ncbi:MAG: hypothetical protein M1365_08010, partial [Actinobacteria bacterium]|nr:hypothetical protein [Actinomycetota bacterium]